MNNIANKDLKETSYIFNFFFNSVPNNFNNRLLQLCKFVDFYILKIKNEKNITKIYNNIKFNTNDEITLNDILKAFVVIVKKFLYQFSIKDDVRDDTFAKLLYIKSNNNNFDPLYYDKLIKKLIKILYILFESRKTEDSYILLNELAGNKNKIKNLLNRNKNKKNSILEFIFNNDDFMQKHELSDNQIINIVKLFNNNNSNVNQNYKDIKNDVDIR